MESTNGCYFEYYSNTLNNENIGREDNSITDLQDDAQLVESVLHGIPDSSTNVIISIHIIVLVIPCISDKKTE